MEGEKGKGKGEGKGGSGEGKGGRFGAKECASCLLLIASLVENHYKMLVGLAGRMVGCVVGCLDGKDKGMREMCFRGATTALSEIVKRFVFRLSL